MHLVLVIVSALVAATVAHPFGPPDGVEPYDLRIVGGHPIDIKEVPFQVSLEINGRLNCGGMLISSKHVLTAAHCVDPRQKDLQVRMGTSFLEKGGKVFNVEKITVHEERNATIRDFDFAVLRLSSNVSFDESIQVVKLPKQGEQLADGTMLNVTGWGLTQNTTESRDHLRVASVPKISLKRCAELYEKESITDAMMCAGFDEGGKDSCQGDSGGPLYIGDVAYGVVSWGYGCAEPSQPGVYANIASVVDWIHDQMKL